MSLQVLKKPLRVLPAMPQRPPQSNIPQTLGEREYVRTAVARYVEDHRATLVPPLVLDELRIHAESVVALNHVDPLYTDYVGVLLSNEVWTEQLATVPFDRRLLLLPKCMRVEDKCPAPFDEFGLLCKQCGLCTIQDLQEEAERLGYAVLVAEGSALVMALIQSGKIDAIVGVSCLSVLERAFPYMEAAAIPGIAIPLLQDDCKDTAVDIDWVWSVVHLTSDDRTRRMDLDALRREVTEWFTAESLDKMLGPVSGDADRVARAWLMADGKRWRPFLTACAYKALQDDPDAPLPESLRRAAVAVECFHKASLVHDDIEDGDERRYGRATLPAEHGIPVALNAGDLLLGEGYRLLAGCGARPDVCAELVRIAARGHRELCLGQGAELAWTERPRPIKADEIIEIFRQKTSPAFDVALGVGAALGGATPETHAVLRDYSDALGIAYQIRDDLEDLAADASSADGFGAPSLLLGLACDRTRVAERERVMTLWQGARANPEDRAAFRALLTDLGIEATARGMLEGYKEQAIRSLPALQHASLKGLLRRVVGKVFRVEIKGWCSEFETRDAAGRQAGAPAAG
jgi:geranylgeranyl diphosphate synthase, type II